MDRGLPASFPVAPAATPAVETPAPYAGTSQLACKRTLLLNVCLGPPLYCGLQTVWFLSGAFWICLQLVGVRLR